MIRRAVALAALAVLPTCASRPSEGVRPPNVVIVFTDDQGWGDVGCYGATGIATPQLDRMAREGIRFTSFYVAQPVCSASRAALLTGRYPNRIGIHGALGPWSENGLPASETTLAELAKSRGYATGIFGKWHLGHRPAFLPTRHGFDTFFGIPYSNDMWPFHPDYYPHPPGTSKRKRGYPPLPLYVDERIVNPAVDAATQRAFTATFTERAIAFIERNRDRPFFCYVAHPMPHVPIFRSYPEVIEEIDRSVGDLLAAIRRLGLDDDTLVVFTSDNGPWLSYGDHAGSSGGLREGKGTTWEGGVRVPCIARWPGQIPAGAVCDEPAMTIDVVPTVARLIGAQAPPALDGRDIGALLRGEPGAKSPHDALYFYYRRNHLHAVRAGRWKLVLPHRYRTLAGESGHGGRPGPYRQVPCGLELYDLRADPAEATDVAAANPSVVRRLERLAARARDDMGDDRPTEEKKR